MFMFVFIVIYLFYLGKTVQPKISFVFLVNHKVFPVDDTFLISSNANECLG